MTDLDLPNLRAIAEAATAGEWHCVEPDDDSFDYDVVGISTKCRIEQSRGLIAKIDVGFSAPVEREQQANAIHIATFSPAAVLALIARAEAAEAKLAAAVEDAPMSDATEAAAIAIYKIACEIGGEPPRRDDISPDSQAVYRMEARAAIEAYEASAWRPIEEYAILGEEFHVLDAHGDLIKVKRHDISGAIEPRTGRWFHAAKFGRAVPDPPPAIAALPLEEME